MIVDVKKAGACMGADLLLVRVKKYCTKLGCGFVQYGAQMRY